MTRTLALCADDFGLGPGISAGIARLANSQRLSAVSCITNSPHWAEQAVRLQGLPESVDIGLHLNFTEGKPLSARLARRWPVLPSLPSLIARAHLHALPQAELRNEVHAQLRAFIHDYGEPPRFIDGHQHVHHLPGLRDIILDMAEHVQPLPALRNTGRVLGPGSGFKRWLIERTGGRALARALKQRVLAHNPALLGAYDFEELDYGAPDAALAGRAAGRGRAVVLPSRAARPQRPAGRHRGGAHARAGLPGEQGLHQGSGGGRCRARSGVAHGRASAHLTRLSETSRPG